MPKLSVNVNLTNKQLNKIRNNENVQLSSSALSGGKHELILDSKLGTKYNKSIKNNTGLRLVSGTFVLNSDDDDDNYMEGNGIFKSIRKRVKKASKKAKNAVNTASSTFNEVHQKVNNTRNITLNNARKLAYDKANNLDKLAKKNITEKNVKTVAIKTAKAGGKYVAKDLAHKAISAPITAGLTYGGVPPPIAQALGDKASAYVSKKTGLDHKIDKTIDGLGFRGYEKEGNGIRGYKTGGKITDQYANANGWPVLIGEGTAFIQHRGEIYGPKKHAIKSGGTIKNFVYAEPPTKGDGIKGYRSGSGIKGYKSASGINGYKSGSGINGYKSGSGFMPY